MEKIIVNKLNKDEVIRRFQQSKQRKQERLKELEEGLRTDFSIDGWRRRREYCHINIEKWQSRFWHFGVWIFSNREILKPKTKWTRMIINHPSPLVRQPRSQRINNRTMCVKQSRLCCVKLHEQPRRGRIFVPARAKHSSSLECSAERSRKSTQLKLACSYRTAGLPVKSFPSEKGRI